MGPFRRTEYERRAGHLPRRATVVLAARFCSEKCQATTEFLQVPKFVSTVIELKVTAGINSVSESVHA